MQYFALAADQSLDIYWVDSEGGGSTLIVTPAALMAIANFAAWRERRRAMRAERRAARLAAVQPAE